MINKLKIENFRGIRSLELGGIAQINIIIGKNGAGKTSLLEAIGIMANPRLPQWIHNYGIWRDLPPSNLNSDYILRSIFNDLDPKQEIKFTYTSNSQEQSLEITPNFKSSYSFESNDQNTNTEQATASESSGSNKDELAGITYHAKCNGAVNETFLKLKPDGFEIQQTIKGQKPNEIKSPGAFFIHGRRATSAGETADALTKLFESKEEDSFLSALKKINPKISRVIPAVRNKQAMVFFDIGSSRLMPMNLLGDGFCRVCLMLTGVISHKSKILIVDEIDSGLHNSVMEEFWTSIIKLAQDQKTQIFCTTHSEEMIQTAVNAFHDTPHLLRVIRIDSNNEKTTAQGYDLHQLEIAKKANLDVR